MIEYKELDPVIHSPLRLAVMTILVAVKEADFSYLKDAVETSDGNLSTHVAKLERAGYVRVRKRFVDRKPRSSYSITRPGRAAYRKYIRLLEQCIKRPS